MKHTTYYVASTVFLVPHLPDTQTKGYILNICGLLFCWRFSKHFSSKETTVFIHDSLCYTFIGIRLGFMVFLDKWSHTRWEDWNDSKIQAP